MNEIIEYKGNNVLKIWNEQWPDTTIMFGKSKWRMVLEHITDISEFVNGEGDKE